MHRSRLAGFIIDCDTDDLEAAAGFCSKALGYETIRSDDPDDENYGLLETGPDEIQVEVQRVQHPSRVHLDIEADDIEAEVARLEKLGAKRIDQVKNGGLWKHRRDTVFASCGQIVRTFRSRPMSGPDVSQPMDPLVEISLTDF